MQEQKNMNSNVVVSGQKIDPLRFRLTSSIRDMERQIRLLHSYVKESDCIVSEFYQLKFDQCYVDPDDPLEELKVRSRYSYPFKDKIINIEPIQVYAFIAELPNGNKLHIGLSAYPDAVPTSFGSVKTGLKDSAFWFGSVHTICFDCTKCDKTDCCFNSHRIAIKILEQAKLNGALKFIFDPAMYWECRDDNRLQRICKRASASG